MKKRLILVLAAVLMFMFTACGAKAQTDNGLPPVEGDNITAADYADENNWALLTQNPDQPIDVFILYPTMYQGENPLAGIDDQVMRERADDWYVRNGSAFETAGNVYMPYYRQLNAVWALSQTPEERDRYALGVPKSDVLAAFQYYLEHYNNGRPFIIASHSQGSGMAKEVVFDYFVKNPEVAERMVAAYIIGMSVTKEDMAKNPNMRFAENADDTGVIISYNVVAPDAEPAPNGVILPGALAINPITWTRTGETAPADASLGSYMKTDSGMEKMMNLADATVVELNNNMEVVICAAADYSQYGLTEEMQVVFGKGSYHNNDISFYYYDLRENAENRVAKYLERMN